MKYSPGSNKERVRCTGMLIAYFSTYLLSDHAVKKFFIISHYFLKLQTRVV